MKAVIFLPFISLALKFFLYVAAGKIRKVSIPLITCAVVAGASILAGMFPLPDFLSFALTIGIAALYIVRSSDVEIYPDGIAIPFVVEVVAAFILSYGIEPFLDYLG